MATKKSTPPPRSGKEASDPTAWIDALAAAESERFGTAPPKTPAEARAFFTALLAALDRTEAGPIEARVISSAHEAWKAFHRQGVRDLVTRRRERAWDLLKTSHEIRERSKWRISTRQQAEAIVLNEERAAPLRGDMVREAPLRGDMVPIPVERWERALDRLAIGVRKRGRPRPGDERLSRDEITVRLLEGEPDPERPRAGKSRAKSAADVRSAASRRPANK